jgi:glutamine synthetase
MRERGDSERAGHLADELDGRGVQAVALTWVDNAGVTRVKAVPTGRLADACTRGVGMSPVFDVFVVDDSITTSSFAGGPVGDLRLYPDLDRLIPLAAQPGWAWAPVDRWTQDGEPYWGCQRRFVSSVTARAAEQGLVFRMAFEVEWFVGRGEGDGTTPACAGPAYGMTRLIELSDYARDVIGALSCQGVPVDQFHPEYAAGQLELSVAATDPVAAADRLVLVKHTIRAVTQAHGFRASFAPVVVPGQVGNGCHLHLSAWSESRNLFCGGPGQYGLTGRGESILAGLLEHLPALCAISAPSVASYLRLVPQHWAGPYQCWGRENREAALRFITGTVGWQDQVANAELKCCDASANPYLVAGAVAAVAAATVDEGLRLPAETTTDPATLPPGSQPPRLPQTLSEAVERLADNDVLRTALDERLLDAILAVRRAEVDLFAGASDEEIAAATRWRH